MAAEALPAHPPALGAAAAVAVVAVAVGATPDLDPVVLGGGHPSGRYRHGDSLRLARLGPLPIGLRPTDLVGTAEYGASHIAEPA